MGDRVIGRLISQGRICEQSTRAVARPNESIRVARNPAVQVAPLQDGYASFGKTIIAVWTSVAANYRAVCRARSKAEFVAKMGVVVEEADEAILWLELMTESGIVPLRKTELLLKEANELTAIFAASKRTARHAA